MMKIVAGLGSIDDYIDYVKAGADEVFIGYVPQKYQLQYGLTMPLNRREVCFYNVQIGSKSELELLKELEKKYKVPVTIAFNGLNYSPESYILIEEIIRECIEVGFNRVIIADLALILYLHEKGIDRSLEVHISGEYGEINHIFLEQLSDFNIKRVIIHRKVSREIILNLIKNTRINYEYEAFMLNEMCHFNGAYCNSVHCDELIPMCKMPYKLSNNKVLVEKEYLDVPGFDGCGLCSLWWMRESGVKYLKVVGRGAYSENMIRDIACLHKCLLILEEASDEKEYIDRMKKDIFNNKCGNNCYYR